MGRLWFAVVAFAVGMCGWLDYLSLGGLVEDWAIYPTDFVTFWTAGRAPWSIVYDTQALTALQSWADFDKGAPRPFPYPPTLLFVLNPLCDLERLPAFLIWTAAGLGAFCLTSWRLVGRWWWLLLASPAVTLAVITGQVTFFVGALLMAGVLLLSERPVLAGVAFGLLATIKPQAALLVPLALLVGKHWRAMGASVVTGGLIGLASLVWHRGLWFDWLRALREFSAIIEAQIWAPKLGLTPTLLARWLTIEGTPLGYAFVAAGVLAGVALVIWAFRGEDRIARYGALVAGFLLVSPYALWYELALLQPVAVALMLRRGWGERLAGLLAYTLFARWLAVFAIAAAIIRRRPVAQA